MIAAKKPTIKMNTSLTRTIIELHEKGYSEDFLMLENYKYRCVRNGVDFHLFDFQIEVLVKAFDDFSGDYKYIHKIDTDSGLRGLLIADAPCV